MGKGKRRAGRTTVKDDLGTSHRSKWCVPARWFGTQKEMLLHRWNKHQHPGSRKAR